MSEGSHGRKILILPVEILLDRGALKTSNTRVTDCVWRRVCARRHRHKLGKLSRREHGS